ncbi:MAG: exodeoxyribonuclease VII large subunit, partial [Bacilli bacterium]|nr:exodeoxyribonuclease VII large subunit [Bacilli bacterium]
GKRLDFAQTSRLSRLSERIEGQRQRMEAVGPVSVLKRGYSLVSDEQGQILTSVAQVEPGKTIKTQMKDGIIVSTVERKE